MALTIKDLKKHSSRSVPKKPKVKPRTEPMKAPWEAHASNPAKLLKERGAKDHQIWWDSLDEEKRDKFIWELFDNAHALASKVKTKPSFKKKNYRAWNLSGL